ncbi:MAG: hypothetical protein WCP82_08140 [Alphaproteobacteria bacterium]|jgi:hypothetical protein
MADDVMGEIYDSSTAREGKIKAFGPLCPQSAEILGAMMLVGGAAHLDDIIRIVAERLWSGTPSPGLTNELIEIFEQQCRTASDRGEPGIFWLPFGIGSRRWSLSADARIFFAAADREGHLQSMRDG